MNGASAPSPAEFDILATGLVHQIRNALNSIRFNLVNVRHSLARPETAAGVPGGTAALVQGIDNEVRRMDAILRDFLRLARPEAPRIEPVPVGALLESVVRLMEAPCRSRNIELSCDCSPGVAAAADPGQLQQVLLNLVLNASQAMSGGGRIRLRGYLGGDQAVMEVADTGPGIPEEVRAQVLQPFFSTRSEGTGLGLNICRRLVEQMNGRLEFRTEVGRGTTFVIPLPRPQGG